MITSIVEFLKTYQQSNAKKCGEPIEEQAECYGNVCQHCIGLKDIK